MTTFVRPREIFSLIVWRIRGSSSARSRGRLITISLCFRFTELSSTLNFLPAWTTSARPYPVMLLIRCKSLCQRNAQRSTESSKAMRGQAVEKHRASVMHACEPLAAGAYCRRHLRNHLRSHQRPATQDSALESPRRGLVRRGTNDCDWGDDTRARVSRNQLRHIGAAAGYDAHLGLPGSRSFFRMGGGTGSEFLANSRASAALCHAHFGNSLGAVSERHNLPDAHPARRGSYQARQAAPSAIPRCARDQRKYWQCGH